MIYFRAMRRLSEPVPRTAAEIGLAFSHGLAPRPPQKVVVPTRSRLRLCVANLVLIALQTALFSPTAFAGSKPYLLGPEDQIRLRVSEFRPGSADSFHEWPALAGEYTVGASGALSLPLIGDLPAEGLTPSELAAGISDRLWKKIGLVQRPEAAVEVSRYRPFYILGGVNRPGSYPYSPSLTVLQAVSTGGGILRRGDDTLNHFEREALSNRGELREISVERDGLLVRQARLEAESRQATTLTFPPDLAARSSDPDIAKDMADQRALWTVRQDSLRSQIASFEETRTLLNQQVQSMEAKSTTLVHQAELANTELTNVRALVGKGYMVTSRQLDLERTATQYASDRLDLDIAMLRARQDMSALDRSITDLQEQRKSSVLQEVGEVRAKLARIAERIQTLKGLIYDAEVIMPRDYDDAMASFSRAPDYQITRRSDGATVSFKAQDGDDVLPGDTIKVILPLPKAASSQLSSTSVGSSKLDE